MNTIVSIILGTAGTIALLYVLAYCVLFTHHYIKYQYETIKIVISRNKRLKHFVNLIYNHQADLKPFLEDLDIMINRSISVPIPHSEKNLILDCYHFYTDVLDRIIDKQKVNKVDLIEFARLHKGYNDMIRDFKKMNNEKFYEENNFFDINLN